MEPKPNIGELIEILRQGTQHLESMAKKLEFPWDPDVSDRRKLHNMYARNLITCYVSRYADLSNAMLSALKSENFLVYALCGRSLIEITATLRYYIYQQYKPLFAKGSLSNEDMKNLISVDDRHLRGTRFDWESFLYKRYQQLINDAMMQAKDRKAKKPTVSNGEIQQQVNVLTCIDRWAEETPAVRIAYALFCELVHPNIGSAFLVASATEGRLFFSRYRGQLVGKDIFEQSFPILLSLTHKPFGEYLVQLMATIWQDDELPA